MPLRRLPGRAAADDRGRGAGGMKISPADKRNFDAVMAHNALDASEIELCKDAYRRDPEAAKRLYEALRAEIPMVEDAREWVKLSEPPFVGKGKRD